MVLGEFLTSGLRRRWQPGEWDCCFFPGAWVETWGRGDPLAEWRGAYSTDIGGLRLIREAGGLLSLWRRGLASIDVPEVYAATTGDVGVVEALTMHGPEPVGAIFTGDRWAICAHEGLIFGPARPLAVWGRPRG